LKQRERLLEDGREWGELDKEETEGMEWGEKERVEVDVEGIE
jgi:hypothetical protein